MDERNSILRTDHDYIIDTHRRVITLEHIFDTLPCKRDNDRINVLESWRDSITGAGWLVAKVGGIVTLLGVITAIYKAFRG